MPIEYQDMLGVKTKRDRQFELLDSRLIDIQGRLGKIRQAQHEQTELDKNRYDALIQMLSPIADLPFIKEELKQVHELLFKLTNTLPPQQKMKGTVMADYSIPDDQPDGRVTFNLAATDAEGQPITDPAVLATLQFEASSSNTEAFSVTLDADQPDPMKRVGGYHVGAPGQAAVTGNLKDADGNLIGTGTDGFTVTTGKVALGSVTASFDGLTPIGG